MIQTWPRKWSIMEYLVPQGLEWVVGVRPRVPLVFAAEIQHANMVQICPGFGIVMFLLNSLALCFSSW